MKETYVGSDGLFKFNKLDPDGKYSIQMDDAIDVNKDFGMYLIAADGTRIPIASSLAAGGEFTGNVVTKTQEEDGTEHQLVDPSPNAKERPKMIFDKFSFD